MIVKRPYLFLVIVFALGYLGYVYGLPALADWIVFCIGVSGVYAHFSY